MRYQLDHLIIAVPDLDAAIADYMALGFVTRYGGVHAADTTHNALIILADGSYIELMAPTGRPPIPGKLDFQGVLGTGLSGYCLLVDDMPAAIGEMHQRGVDVEAPISGERLRGDGVRLAWQMARIEGGYRPFIIVDETERSLRVPVEPERITHPNGVQGIAGLRLNVADPHAEASRLAAIFGVQPGPEQAGEICFDLPPIRGARGVELRLSASATDNAPAIGEVLLHGGALPASDRTQGAILRVV